MSIPSNEHESPPDAVAQLQIENDRLRQDTDSLRAERDQWCLTARSFQEVSQRKGFKDPNFWLAILTGATLFVLMRYTWETDALRKTSLKQVIAANTQNEISTESRVWPIVVLGLDQTSGTLLVQNIGFGPAVNSSDILMTHGKVTWDLYHAASLESGGHEPVGILELIDNEPDHRQVPTSQVEKKLKALFPEVTKPPGKELCLAYENVNGEWYETRQALLFSSEPALKGMYGIIIRFLCTHKVGIKSNACLSTYQCPLK